jgi:putative redox protein
MSVQKNSARMVWKGEGLEFQGSVGSGYSFAVSGGDHKTGGGPMEFLLAGVAGCTAIDVVLILQKQRQKVTGVEVEASGLRATEDPKVYTDVELVYIVRGENIDPRAVERAISLSEEKYCSASNMFVRAGVQMHSTYRIESND